MTAIVGGVELDGTALTVPDAWTLRNPEDILSRTVRANDTPHPTAHGILYGRDLLDARKIVFDITVHPDPSVFVETLDQISALFTPTDDVKTLIFSMYEGLPRTLYGRPRNFSCDVSQYGYALIKAEFVCADPRMYSEWVTNIIIPSLVVTGLGFNISFDIGFTANSSTTVDTVTINNIGNVAAPYSIAISTSATNPRVTHAPSGRFLQLDIEAGAGPHWVLLNSADRTIQYFNDFPNPGDGQIGINVYDWLTADSTWFDVAPGANTFTAEDTSGLQPWFIINTIDAWI